MRLRSFFIVAIFSLFFNSSIFAKQLINGISVLVNDEPITLYEIHSLSKQMDIPLRESLELLVQNRLETSQAKKLGIRASDYEVNKALGKIAQKNGISTYELRQVVKSKGIKYADYKKQIAQDIKRKKLFEQIFKDKNAKVSEAEIRSYYQAHPEKFQVTDIYEVTAYRADNKKALENVVASPMSVASGATLTKESLHSSVLDKRIAYFLGQTQTGRFTPIITTSSGYVMYFVDKKVGLKTIELDRARIAIENELEKDIQKKAVKNYFEKLKSSASIVVLRKP